MKRLLLVAFAVATTSLACNFISSIFSDQPSGPSDEGPVSPSVEGDPCRVTTASESGHDGGGVISDSLRMVRFTLEGEQTELGTVSIPFNGEKEEPHFLNVLGDLNGDGVWSTSPSEWIVQNLAVAITKTDYSTYFSTADLTPSENLPIGFRVVVSLDRLGVNWDCRAPTRSEVLDATAFIELLDTQILADPAEGFVGAGGGFAEPAPQTVHSLQEDLNLETLFYRPGVPDLDQGPNTCVGHSMANSLAWLAQKHGFADKFQVQRDAQGNELTTFDVTTLEGQHELAWDMISEWESAKAYTPATGVPSDKIVSGKKAYVQKRGLPITVDEIGDTQGKTTFDAIKQALKDGCDVEVVLLVQTEAGPKAHMVTVVGFSDITISGQPSQTLVFHDPGTANATSANGVGNDVYNYDASTASISSFPFLGKTYTAKLAFAVKQCPQAEDEHAGVSGIYSVEFAVALDPAQHKSHVDMPSQMDLTVRQSEITFEGPSPFVPVTGTFEEDGSFTATGVGVVAGFANIVVSFEGVIRPESLTGSYAMGVNGGLPTGQPIVFAVDGMRTAELSSFDPGQVEDFYDAFNSAFVAQDTASLYDRLHPAVLDQYGEAACRAYLDEVVSVPIEVNVLEVIGLGEWDWEMDGLSTSIPETYTARVNFSAQGQTSEIETHLAIRPDGQLGWFTDCGDPLP